MFSLACVEHNNKIITANANTSVRKEFSPLIIIQKSFLSTYLSFRFFFFFFFWCTVGYVAYGILFPTLPVLEVWSLNHQATREVSLGVFIAVSVTNLCPTLATPSASLEEHFIMFSVTFFKRKSIVYTYFALLNYMAYLGVNVWENWLKGKKEQHGSNKCSVVSDLLGPHELKPTRLFCPWNFPENTGVGCHFLLQGIFLTQGLNLGILHCRQTLYHLSHQGSPSFLN